MPRPDGHFRCMVNEMSELWKWLPPVAISRFLIEVLEFDTARKEGSGLAKIHSENYQGDVVH